MFKVKLSGMGEYEIKLNSLVSEKLILSNLDKATKEIGNEIENRISARYNSKGLSSQKPIYSPIFKEGSKFSKTISYTESVQNAGIFITKREVGNIEPKAGKKRKGVIHYITVKTGKEKISYGKYGLGGFSIVRGGKRFLLTRVSRAKFPLKPISSLSKAEMAVSIVRADKVFQRKQIAIMRKIFK
jgi:hypothetical protein